MVIHKKRVKIEIVTIVCTRKTRYIVGIKDTVGSDKSFSQSTHEKVDSETR